MANFLDDVGPQDSEPVLLAKQALKSGNTDRAQVYALIAISHRLGEIQDVLDRLDFAIEGGFTASPSDYGRWDIGTIRQRG